MVIREVSSGKDIDVIIEPVVQTDLKKLTIKRYFFNWKNAGEETTLWKLSPKGNVDIKGVMALVDYPGEHRIEVKLLAVSRENVILKKEQGKKLKEYEGIAGNLLAFACRIAITKYGDKGCVSLLPKTELKEHYINEYGMVDAGYHVFLELDNLQDLLEKYEL